MTHRFAFRSLFRLPARYRKLGGGAIIVLVTLELAAAAGVALWSHGGTSDTTMPAAQAPSASSASIQ